MFFSIFKHQSNEDKFIYLGEGEDQIIIKIQRHARARNIKLKIKLNGEVELVLPYYVQFEKGYSFLLKKEEWLRSRIKKIENKNLEIISILGEEHKLIRDCLNLDSLVEIKDNCVFVSYLVKEEKLENILMMKLKYIAKCEIKELLVKYAAKLGVSYNRVDIKDTITKWGSCSSFKNLSFSWRLVLAPREVMEYVVIHELCHLKEMNHSPKFWKLVYQLMPEYFQAKLWLKNNGKKLYMYFN